jgi:hypothetical protein
MSQNSAGKMEPRKKEAELTRAIRAHLATANKHKHTT